MGATPGPSTTTTEPLPPVTPRLQAKMKLFTVLLLSLAFIATTLAEDCVNSCDDATSDGAYTSCETAQNYFLCFAKWNLAIPGSCPDGTTYNTAEYSCNS